jgi:hypothetical protein
MSLRSSSYGMAAALPTCTVEEQQKTNVFVVRGCENF